MVISVTIHFILLLIWLFKLQNTLYGYLNYIVDNIPFVIVHTYSIFQMGWNVILYILYLLFFSSRDHILHVFFLAINPTHLKHSQTLPRFPLDPPKPSQTLPGPYKTIPSSAGPS